MSGDFVFTVYGLILHAEEYFSINKNMTAGEKIFYIVLLTKRGRGLLTKLRISLEYKLIYCIWRKAVRLVVMKRCCM